MRSFSMMAAFVSYSSPRPRQQKSLLYFKARHTPKRPGCEALAVALLVVDSDVADEEACCTSLQVRLTK